MQQASNETGVRAGGQEYAGGWENAGGQDNEATNVASDRPAPGDYTVGRCRPPLHTRFKPGKSGNPKGRGKGHLNAKTEIRQIMSSRLVAVDDGENVHRPSLLGANVLAHGLKGAKGDARSAGIFLTLAEKMGVLDPDVDAVIEQATRDRRAALIGPTTKSSSDALIENLDLALLSREEQIEVSRLAEIIDIGGDITALSVTDFERFKYIVNKGRGKDITLQ
jgi:hypothetical protein